MRLCWCAFSSPGEMPHQRNVQILSLLRSVGLPPVLPDVWCICSIPFTLKLNLFIILLPYPERL